MRVVVADEIVLDDGFEEPREVDHGRARYVAEQPEALPERRPAFLLVCEFGDDAKRLAEIFLMKPFEHRRATGGFAVMAPFRNNPFSIDTPEYDSYRATTGGVAVRLR
ncbi:MAG: hypothetical protein WB762_11495 [Candidatus Sulfotelmatobacter sp.]